MSQLKVALVSEEYPPHIIGGVGTFSYHLASWLAKKGIRTTIFCGKSQRLSKVKVNDFLDIVRLPCFGIPPRYIWFQLQNFSYILRKLNEFSVIHATSPEVSPICVYFRKALRRPLLTSFHGVTSYEMKAFVSSPTSQWSPSDLVYHVLEYPLYHASNRLAIANSDHIVACSYTLLNELRSIYSSFDPRKASVIYNGIDIEELDNIVESGESTNCCRNPTVIFYGRLLWIKGIVFLLSAFKLLLTKYPNLQLEIYGEGPLRRRILAIVSKSGLGSNVHVRGQISRSKLLVEIAKADVVVLPSLREGQPISALEAMACKKPIVAFDLPFASEYVHNSFNGLLAKRQDSDDLAAKVDVLLASKTLRTSLGQNAYDYVKHHHNWDSLVNKYIDVYNQLADVQQFS